MANERLLQYISSLSEEEKQKFRELIQETLQRDKIIEETFAKTKIYIEDFAEDLRSILKASLNVKTGLSALNEKLIEVKDASQTISKMINTGQVWN